MAKELWNKNYVRNTVTNLAEFPIQLQRYISKKHKVRLEFTEESFKEPLCKYEWKATSHLNSDMIRNQQPIRSLLKKDLKKINCQYYHYVFRISGTKSRRAPLTSIFNAIPGINLVSVGQDSSSEFQLAILVYLVDFPKLWAKYKGSIDRYEYFESEFERLDLLNQEQKALLKEEYLSSDDRIKLLQEIADLKQKIIELQNQDEHGHEIYIESYFEPYRMKKSDVKLALKHQANLESIGIQGRFKE